MSDISLEHVLSSQYTVFDGAGWDARGRHLPRSPRFSLDRPRPDGGVSRFDSAHFDNFGLKDGLPNLTVMATAEDADGRLLVRYVRRRACRVRWVWLSGVHY